MTPARLTVTVALLQRRRFCAALFEATPTFKQWSADQQYVYRERIGICCGKEPVSMEAHVLAREDAERIAQ